MNSVEIFVSIFGVFLGYWIIGSLIGGFKGPKAGDDTAGRAESTGHAPGPDASWTERAEAEPKPWHEVLGVSPRASLDEVQVAYRECIGKYHPDKVASLGQELRDLAEAKSKEINRAYNEALAHVGHQG